MTVVRDRFAKLLELQKAQREGALMSRNLVKIRQHGRETEGSELIETPRRGYQASSFQAAAVCPDQSEVDPQAARALDPEIQTSKQRTESTNSSPASETAPWP